MLNKDKIFLYCDRAIVASLCFLIFCLPFSKTGIESFILLAFVLWVLKKILGYRNEVLWGMFPKTELSMALGIFIAVNALSVIFSSDFGLSLRGFFIKELKFLAVYFMLVEVINNEKRLKIVLIAVIASVVLIVADAGVQYFTSVDFIRGYRSAIITASFQTQNGFTGWSIVIIPLLLGLLAPNRIIRRKNKIFLAVPLILLLSCLLFSYSRGGWLGFIAGAFFMIYHTIANSTSRIKILCLSAFAGLLVISLILPFSIKAKIKDNIRVNFKSSQAISDRMKSIPKLNVYSNAERIMFWKEALRITRDHPLIGCGLNTYSTVVRDYKSFEGGGIYPHNSYLQMAAETGLLGLFAFLWVLFTFFKTGLRHFYQKKDYLTLGLLSGILAFLVHAFFDNHLYALQLVVLFWYMLGLTIAVIKLER